MAMTEGKINKIHTLQKYFTAVAAVVITLACYGLWLSTKDPGQHPNIHAQSCTVTAILENPCRPWVGTSSGGYSQAAGDNQSQLIFFNKRLNDPSVLNTPSKSVTLTNKMDVAHLYHAQGTNLFTATDQKVLADAAAGTTSKYVFVNWKPLPGGSYTWKDACGVADASTGCANNATVNAYITAGANAVKALGGQKIFLTIWHEPENQITSGNCTSNASGANEGSPAQYVAMWNNVHNIFNNVLGSTNGQTNGVVWAMNYMGYSKWDCLVKPLWPGNFVNWVMWDPYGSGGQLFNGSFEHFYGVLQADSNTTYDFNDKPWGFAEMGYGNPKGDSTEANAAAYWQQAQTYITNGTTYKNLKMFLVFDTSVNGNSQVGYTFAGATSTSEQSAYNSFADAIFAKQSTPVTPPADTTPPTVSITGPANGSSVSGTVTVSANASDNVGVTEVKLYVDSTLIKDDTNASDGWSSPWSTASQGNGTHTLKATAYDAAGNATSATSTIVISNAGAPVIKSFTASPTSVASGGKSTLTWSDTGATSCAVTPGGPTGTTTSWQTGALTSTTTFTLTCTNSSGTANKTVQVSVVSAPAITSFTANPSTVIVGNPTTLAWATTSTSGCSVTPGGPSNTTATSWQTLGLGTVGTTTYTLTCSNSLGQSTNKTVQVAVQTAPTPPSNVALVANSTQVTTGGSVTLSWTSTNATSCVLNPGSFTASGSGSSKTITNLKTTTTYKVTCSNNAGSTGSNSVKVTVAEASAPPAAPTIASFTATPSSIASGGASTLAWSASNVVDNGCNLTPSPLTSTSSTNQWTTPALTASVSYTLTCKNSANVTVSKSVSVIVAGQAAPAAPPEASPSTIDSNSGASKTISGKTVVNVQVTGSANQGDLISLDASTVTDDAVAKVEYYNGQTLLQTVTSQPFALDTKSLKPGSYTLTQRTYYTDGSSSQTSQIVVIKAKKAAAFSHWSIIWWAVGLIAVLVAAGFGVRWFLVWRYERSVLQTALSQPLEATVLPHTNPEVINPQNQQQPRL